MYKQVTIIRYYNVSDHRGLGMFMSLMENTIVENAFEGHLLKKIIHFENP